MRGAALVAIVLAAGCGKQVNPLYCMNHPEDTQLCHGDARAADAGKMDAPPDTPPGYFDVGGSITGLMGTGAVLQNNGGDDLPINAGATSFVFSGLLMTGQTYSVGVLTQPLGQMCSVTMGSGTVANANVRSVVVTCVQGPDPGVTCGGTVCDLGSAKPDCCYGASTCGTTTSCTTPMACDDLYDCAGTANTECCAYLNPGSQPKNAVCTTASTCAMAAHGAEVLCDPANGDADCTALGKQCMPAQHWSGYHSCQ